MCLDPHSVKSEGLTLIIFFSGGYYSNKLIVRLSPFKNLVIVSHTKLASPAYLGGPVADITLDVVRSLAMGTVALPNDSQANNM